MRRKVNPAKEDTLALQVAHGKSLRRAAKVAELAPTTARRMASEPAFKIKVADLRRGLLDQAVGKLSGRASRAAEVLGELLRHPDARVRLASARAILLDGIAFSDHAQLIERITALESKLDDNPSRAAP